jgi:hypothetical protein
MSASWDDRDFNGLWQWTYDLYGPVRNVLMHYQGKW